MMPVPERPLRILQVIPALNGGGVEEETLQLARALKAEGHEPLVASQGGDMVALLEGDEISHACLPLATKNPLKIANNACALGKIVREWQVDLIHVRSRAPAWSVALCHRECGVPWVATYHAAYQGESALKRLYNSVMARAPRVIAISRFIEGHVKKTYGGATWFRPQDVRFVPRGVDVSYFAPDQVSTENRNKLRQALSVPSDSPVVLLPGRFRRVKGQDLLLHAAAAILAETDRRVTFLLVGETPGDGGYAQELRCIANDLGIAGHTRFVPYAQDLRPFYAIADLVIVPSRVPEGFGRTVAEACAFGGCVIASKSGAIPEIIVPDETGFLFEPGDVAALVRVLRQALLLPDDHRASLGHAARHRVKTLFSSQQFYLETMRVYREILGSA